MTEEKPVPTPAEMEVLGLLWRHGAQTVREVHDRILERREVGYTTVLKALQVMTEKGLVTRDESSRSHVYTAAVAEESVKRRLVHDLVDRVFDGSASSLMVQLLSNRPASASELDELKKLIEKGRG